MKNPDSESLDAIKIRIAHILFSLEPGGMENGVVNISNGLNSTRFETRVVCLERVGSFGRRLRRDVKVCCLEKQEGLSFKAVFSLALWIRRNRPSVIHTHNLGPLFYAVLGRALAFSRVPIVHGEHGMLRPDDLTRKRLIIRRLLYMACRVVHTVSDSLREYLGELGFAKNRILPVLNGVDCRRFCPVEDRAAIRQAWNLPENGLVIGMIGRLVESKRHLMMLDAFQEIAEAFSGAYLLLVGDGGDYREEVLGAVECHPNRGRIIWVGYQEDTLPFYQAMDLLAMPSDAEGMSNALLEAMACGVPAVANSLCGAGEVIKNEENGILGRIDCSTDVANIIMSLLRDSQKRGKLGKMARETAEKSFSIESMVQRYSSLYSDVVKNV